MTMINLTPAGCDSYGTEPAQAVLLLNQAAIGVAARMVPSAASHLTLKKHHGRADAVLLAEYGRTHT